MEHGKNLGFGDWLDWWNSNLVISELGSKKINLSKPQFPYPLDGITVQMSQNFGGYSRIKESVQYNDTWTWNPWHGTDRCAFPQSSSCVLWNIGPGVSIGKTVERIYEVGMLPLHSTFFLFTDFLIKVLNLPNLQIRNESRSHTQLINGRLGSQNRHADWFHRTGRHFMGA